jgi:hypothetical protein
MHAALGSRDKQNAMCPTIAALPGRPPLTWTASTQLRGPFFFHANERSGVADENLRTLMVKR